MSSMGFIPDVLFLGITFFFLVKYREKIASWLLKIPLPNYVTFLLTIFVLSVIEENINSGFPFFIIPFIPWTVPILMLQVMILAWAMNKWASSIKWPLIIYMIFGVLWEMVLGGLRGQLGVIPLWLYLFMIFWVALSYAYVSIIPLVMRRLTTRE